MVDATLLCPDCGANMAFKIGKHGPFYGCSQWADTGCKGSHTAYPDGTPVGFPANAATRKARATVMTLLERIRRTPGVLAPPVSGVGRWTSEDCEPVILDLRWRLGEYTRYDRELLAYFCRTVV